MPLHAIFFLIYIYIQSYFLDINYLAQFFYSMVLYVKSTLAGKINK